MKKTKQTSKLAMLGVITCLACSCTNNNQLPNPSPSYPIDESRVFTTVDSVIVPRAVTDTTVLPYQLDKYDKYGYGRWRYIKGFPYRTELTLMEDGYKKPKPVASLLNFFTISDIHITDEETPAQGVVMGLQRTGSVSAYSGVMLYSTQVLDATIQTVNALNKKKKIDFGLSLGDNCNNEQLNELRWFIDVMDGKVITPDSGIKDDPIPGPHNDYQDSFKAAGLNKSIPWYQTLGNHDHFFVGTNPVDAYIRPYYTGNKMLLLGNVFKSGVKGRDLYMGALDGSTVYGKPYGAGKKESFKVAPTVPADADRRVLTVPEWMKQHFDASPRPAGHGFSGVDAQRGFACYTFEPKANIPLRVLVLDDTQEPDNTNDSTGYGHSYINKERLNWLVNQLEKGQRENKLMIIAAHAPINIKQEGQLKEFLGWSKKSCIELPEFMKILHRYSNLILWASGHRHLSVVTPQPSPHKLHPEFGFWEVETPSLREFPQQFRMFEIVRNSDNTISIISTNVDPAVKKGSLADKSRSYAVANTQLFVDIENKPTAQHCPPRNVVLVKKLSPIMQNVIKRCGTAIK